jgi:hypothetical protein
VSGRARGWRAPASSGIRVEFLSVYFRQERQEIKSTLIHTSSVIRA